LGENGKVYGKRALWGELKLNINGYTVKQQFAYQADINIDTEQQPQVGTLNSTQDTEIDNKPRRLASGG
jgi:hypothetical protein